MSTQSQTQTQTSTQTSTPYAAKHAAAPTEVADSSASTPDEPGPDEPGPDEQGRDGFLVPVDAREPHLTPASMLRRDGQWDVLVQGVALTRVPNRADATTALAKEAVRRQETLLATVRESSHKTYLTFAPDGQIKQSAPPPPGALRPDYSTPSGGAEAVEDAHRSWVEETLLTPSEPTPPRRWFGFLRR